MSTLESFRDPQGKVIVTKNQVWRLIDQVGVLQLRAFLNLKLVQEWQRAGRIVETILATEEESESFAKNIQDHSFRTSEFNLYKHQRIKFPSYPHEWPPQMLYEAGRLTLEMAESLRCGWGLKDASPYNILFQGSSPIFIDILSFEQRRERDPVWLPYNQFVQTFLLPLLVNKEIGLPLETIFLSNREGLPLSEAAKFFSNLKKFQPKILSLVTLPTLLSRYAKEDSNLYKCRDLKSVEQTQFVLRHSFRRLLKQLEDVSPDPVCHSRWTAYTKFNQETIPDYMRAKEAFVAESINELKPKSVLDVGCNTGFFSFLAARAQADVVAIDYDPAVIGQVFRSARKEDLKVLPLVVNIVSPSPRMGWRLTENASFLDRALGHFDLVMMLAVTHHLLVQERIPLREILRLASDLTKDALIIEFVAPADRLFKRLARGREHLHSDLTIEKFTDTAEEFFHIIRSQQLPQTERWLYLMRKDDR